MFFWFRDYIGKPVSATGMLAGDVRIEYNAGEVPGRADQERPRSRVNE